MAETAQPSIETSTIPEIPVYNLNKFKNIGDNILGEGSAACVYQMYHPHFGEVALKNYGKPVKILEDREVRVLLKNSKHPNIIQIYGRIEEDHYPGHICGYIMEYMNRRSLHYVLHNYPEDCTRGRIFSWITQAGRGLDYLHRSNVLHRDIKPQNMLLGPIERLKLSDFGVSREFDRNSNQSITVEVGTYLYMAPEIYDTQNSPCRYDQTADVYSLTISIWEMFCRKTPYSHLQFPSNYTLCEGVIKGKRPDCEDSNLAGETEIRDILTRGWHKIPEKRPPIKEFIDLAERLGAISSGSNPEDV